MFTFITNIFSAAQLANSPKTYDFQVSESHRVKFDKFKNMTNSPKSYVFQYLGYEKGYSKINDLFPKISIKDDDFIFPDEMPDFTPLKVEINQLNQSLFQLVDTESYFKENITYKLYFLLLQYDEKGRAKKRVELVFIRIINGNINIVN